MLQAKVIYDSIPYHAIDFRSAFQLFIVYSRFEFTEGDNLMMPCKFGARMPKGAFVAEEICAVQAPGNGNFSTVVITGFT